MQQRAQQEKERSVENLMFLRFLKAVLQQSRHVESLKSVLFSHKGFTVEEAFALIDSDKDGTIELEEVEKLMLKHRFDCQGLHHLFADGDVTYSQWKKLLTPAGIVPRTTTYEGTFEQRET